MRLTWFPSVPAAEVPAAVVSLAHARARLLQFLRAFEALGLDPREHPRLRYPLVKIVECDVVLLGNLARMRQGRSPRGFAAFVPQLAAIAEDKRRRARQALPPDVHEPLLSALAGVEVRVQDMLAEADAVVLDGPSSSLAGLPLPLDEATAQRLAETGWGTPRLPWPWHARHAQP